MSALTPRPRRPLPPAGEERGTLVAAVDGSAASLAALRTAGALAGALGLRLQAVFVEDEELLRLGAMPFSRVVGAYTAQVRALQPQLLARELQAAALRAQRAAAVVAATWGLTWRFDVRRGRVAAELAAAAANADLLSVGRVGRLAGRLGSTPRALLSAAATPLLLPSARPSARLLPLALLQTGSDAAERAWRLALRLAAALATPAARGPLLHILALPEAAPLAHARAAQAEALGLPVVLTTATPGAAALLLQRALGAVLLPRDAAAAPFLAPDHLPAVTLLVVP